MKVSHILSASVIAGSLLFAGTACGNNNPEPVSSPSASSSAIAAENAAKPTDNPETPATESSDSAGVLEVVNDYYAFIVSPEAKASVKQLTEKFGDAEPTPEQIQSLVAEHPEIYKYYDTSTVENIKNATQEFAMAATFTAMGEGKVSFKAPAEAISVNGDTATLDTGAVIVTVNGEKVENEGSAGAETVTFTKKDGKWVMVAKPFPISSNTAPTTAPQG